MTGPERGPATIAALPEVQALIAAAYEDAARLCDAKHADYMISKGRDPKKYESAHSLLARSIRNLTPAEATAALAQIEREAEARGRAMGLREAAGVCRKVRASSADESEGVGALDCASAILARAAEIEKEGGASVQTGARINDHQRN
jgi:hypothetical protein